LADDLRLQHRYNAACAAARASSGQGKDANKLDEKERARLRQQALDWLRADLTCWAKTLDEGNAQTGAQVQQQMRHWLTDTDLAGFRDKGALDKLPDAERKEWHKLWADVDALLKRARDK
jgi:hypothetical protein